MKQTELMIGDWVHIPMLDDATENYVCYSQVRQLHDCDLDCYAFKELKYEEVKPIPLTAEILERNGFSKVPQTECSNPYHWTLERYEEGSEGLLYRIKAYKTLFRGMYVIIYNYADCEQINFGKQIECVHELQHALHLCGLSDLVDKLKVEEKI